MANVLTLTDDDFNTIGDVISEETESEVLSITDGDLDDITLISEAEEQDIQAVGEQSNYLGGMISGLDESASFNLAREGRSLLTAKVFKNNDWFFGKAFYGDKPWTEEVEEGVGWISAEEQMGVSDEVWDAMSHSERVKQLHKVSQQQIQEYYNPDVDSAAYMVSKFTGVLTDPTTALAVTSIPAFMTVGAVDASLYEHGTTGELSPTTPLIGGAFGYGGGKLVNKLAVRAETKQATEVLNVLQNEMAVIATKGNLSPIAILNQAKKNLNLTDEAVDIALGRANRKLKIPTAKTAREQIEESSRKQIMPGSKTAFGQSLDKIIEPISEGIKRISPRIYGKLQQAERLHFENGHKYAMMVDPFLRKAFQSKQKFLNKQQQTELNHLMLNAKTVEQEKGIEKFLRNALGDETLVKDYKMYRQAMNEIHAERIAAGNTKLKHISGFSPRRIVNYNLWYRGLAASERGGIDKMLETESKKLGKKVVELTDDERGKIISKFLTFPSTSKAIKKVTSAQKRKINKISAGQVNAYEDPWHATHKYIKESQEEIQRFKIFGSKNIDAGDDLNKTVANFIAQEQKAGRLKGTDVDAMKNYLEARFVFGPQQMNKYLSSIKDTGYMTLLGHPTNAVRQFGDLALSAWKNGVVNTTVGVYKTISGKGMTAKEMGLLDNIAQEFASDTVTKRGLDFSFKYSGFRSVDALGKGALVNSTLRKSANRMSTRKGQQIFRDEWAAVLGADDAAKVMDDFKAFKAGTIDKPTRLMKDVAFMDLAKIQPITLLEMPEAYLKNPNGRIMYMLKTFTMKHINLMRQEGFKQIRNGNTKQGVKSLAVLSSFFTLGNMGVDKVNDLILGRDTKLEDSFWVNLYRNTGLLSKYDVEQMIRTGDVYDIVKDTIIPPFDPMAKGVVEAGQIAGNVAQGKNWQSGLKHPGEDFYVNIPIIGRLMKAWID